MSVVQRGEVSHTCCVPYFRNQGKPELKSIESRIDSRISLCYSSGKFPRFRLEPELESQCLNPAVDSRSSKYSWDHNESGQGSLFLIFWSHPSLPGAASTSWPTTPTCTRFFRNTVHKGLEKGSKTEPNHWPSSPPNPVPKSRVLNNSRDGNSTSLTNLAMEKLFLIFNLNSPAQPWGTFGRDPLWIELLHEVTWLYPMQVWLFLTQFIIFFLKLCLFWWGSKETTFLELFHLFLLFNPGVGVDPVVGLLLWWAGNHGKGDSTISEGSLTALVDNSVWFCLPGFQT